jgi:hypothetical protein
MLLARSLRMMMAALGGGFMARGLTKYTAVFFLLLLPS